MAPSDASRRTVKKASKMANPVEKLQCLPAHEDRKTTDGELITFETYWATHLSDKQAEWAFDLFKRNMFHLYSISQWGWDPESKKQELNATTARFIIAKNSNGEAIGYTHYRFDMDHSSSVLYCYEIQVEERYQKKGVGTLLMQTMETLAERTGMEKVMATVFAFNEKSLGFFHKLGYEADVTCPDENQGRDYLILSTIHSFWDGISADENIADGDELCAPPVVLCSMPARVETRSAAHEFVSNIFVCRDPIPE